jgi:hypothetical protein
MKNAMVGHFKASWDWDLDNPYTMFGWPLPDLYNYFYGWYSGYFFTNADEMLDAIVSHDCIGVQGLTGTALVDCRSNWIDQLVLSYQAGLAENNKAHIFWLTSDPQCMPVLLRTLDDFTVITDPSTQPPTFLSVFNSINGTTLWLNGFSAWGAPDPEHVRFCARLPGRTVLDSSTCVDFDVTNALPFP